MNTENFVVALKAKIKSLLPSIIKSLIHPPGRKPAELLVKQSEWYNSLSENDKIMANSFINTGIESAGFQILCILDGVSFLENTPEKGTFELYFVKDGKRTLLNNPEKQLLHDIFNWE